MLDVDLSNPFARFEWQGSGCVAYGVEHEGRRLFVKVARTAAAEVSLLGAYGLGVRTWMVPLVLTVVIVAALLTVVPLGDGSYQCQRRPISLVREPAVETGDDSFFDEGAACNADARRRVTAAAGIAVVGALVTIGVALAPRLGARAARPRPPRAAAPG